MDESGLDLIPLLLEGLVLPSVGLDLVEEFLHLEDLVDQIDLPVRQVALSEEIMVGGAGSSCLLIFRDGDLDLLEAADVHIDLLLLIEVLGEVAWSSVL